MKNAIRCFSLGLVLATTVGCAICCSPEDYTYSTFGGKYERVDPAYGRVGSIYSDPNAHWGTPFEPKTAEPPAMEEQLPQPGDDGMNEGPGIDTSIPSVLYGSSTTGSTINGPKRR